MRKSSLDLGLWTAAGYEASDTRQALAAFEAGLTDPNMAYELRIPRAAEYT